MQNPEISVIIPTHNRASLLRETLESLYRQNIDKIRFDVIVVDDGSQDGTDHVIESFRRRLPLLSVPHEHNGYRVARIRNIGVRYAKSPLLLFLDSGVVVNARAIENYLAAYRANSNVEVQIGAISGMNWRETTDTPDTQVLSQLAQAFAAEPDHLLANPDPRAIVLTKMGVDFAKLPAPWAFCWTCNLSVTKHAFDKVGGFDEAFCSWGCEDLEFGYRLMHARASFMYNVGAGAMHLPHARSAKSNFSTNQTNKSYMLQKHPSRDMEMFQTTAALNINALLLQQSTSFSTQ